MNAIKSYNWKLFFILLAASVFGVIAVLPYALALQADTLSKITLPIPLPLLLTIQTLQNAVLFALVIGLGLILAKRIGLGLPILEAKLQGESVAARVKAILLPSILPGIIASIVIIVLDQFVFAPALMAQMGSETADALTKQASQPTAWQGLLASFYGGINEEILLRLFVLSLLAWLGKFISYTVENRSTRWISWQGKLIIHIPKMPEELPTKQILWTANILAAVLFGLGHLPATATIMAITPVVVVRAIVLNGLAGIVFGYLYWTRGLESAMLSHFSADIVLHVLAAL